MRVTGLYKLQSNLVCDMFKGRRGPAGGKTKKARQAAVPESTHLQEWTFAAILKEKALYVGLPKPPADWAAEPPYTAARVAEQWKLSVDTIRSRFESKPGVMIDHRPRRGPGRYQTLAIPASVALQIIPFANAPLEDDEVGKLLLHTAKNCNGDGKAAPADPHFVERLAAYGLSPSDLAFGAIIGMVRPIGCCQMRRMPEPDPVERAAGRWEPDRYLRDSWIQHRGTACVRFDVIACRLARLLRKPNVQNIGPRQMAVMIHDGKAAL